MMTSRLLEILMKAINKGQSQKQAVVRTDGNGCQRMAVGGAILQRATPGGRIRLLRRKSDIDDKHVSVSAVASL